MDRIPVLLPLALLVFLAGTGAVHAQDGVFDAPEGFLEEIRDFITGTGGVLLGGLVIAGAAIAAAAPRTTFNWGQFFIVLVVVAIFFGAFQIAEVLQSANSGSGGGPN